MEYLKKELYELIKADESIFDFIQDVSLDGLWYWDIENPGNQWINSRFWLTLGYNPGEMPDKTSQWKNMIHPDDLASLTADFNNRREDPAHLYDQVVRYAHKNGSTVWIRSRGMAIRNTDSKATRMLVAHTDITKEKEIEEKHRLLFDSIDEGYCIIEMIFDENKKPVDYRFLVINASFEKQTGLVNAVGKTMREFAPNHEEHWFETYGKIALTGESIRFENRAEQLNRWYDVYAFRFGEPKNLQVAILFNDITERKQAENTIMLLNKELAHNLGQIESVNKELEAFSYSVSHDLRAPLRAINGYAHMLEDKFNPLFDEEGKRLLLNVQTNAKKMGILIDDLLAFARLGKSAVQKIEIDMNQLIEDVLTELKKQNDLRAEVKVATLHPAQGDHALIKQVIVNLVSNGIKYSSKKENPVVEITSEKQNNQVVYTVKDNGAGFDMRYADKLFGIFQRLHSDKEFEGTGVGLATVKRIINKHGGSIQATAEVGKGAAFTFMLPAGG